jgi:nitric oxide reductase subunit C
MKAHILLTSIFLATASAPAWAADAQELYAKKCQLCHSIKGEGGKKKDFGGPLDGVGNKRDEAWLKAYLVDPKSKIDGAKMPKMKLAAEELDAIVQYLLALK